jgi:ATP-dependent DNA ligase
MDSRRLACDAPQEDAAIGDNELSVYQPARIKKGRWGQGLTAEKMKDCRWVKPVLVGQFEFLEWTGDNHLRHSRFIALREDKDPTEVVRENHES